MPNFDQNLQKILSKSILNDRIWLHRYLDPFTHLVVEFTLHFDAKTDFLAQNFDFGHFGQSQPTVHVLFSLKKVIYKL